MNRLTRPAPKPKQTPKAPTKRIPAINRKRKAKRFERDYAGPYAEWIRAQPCCCQARGHFHAVEAAHVRSRGAGGHAHANLLPLCGIHHRLQHIVGWLDIEERFLRRNRFELAQEFQAKYDAQTVAG